MTLNSPASLAVTVAEALSVPDPSLSDTNTDADGSAVPHTLSYVQLTDLDSEAAMRCPPGARSNKADNKKHDKAISLMIFIAPLMQ